MSVFVGGFEIDAALTENEDREADVTDHPIEESADVSDLTDHVRLKPITVRIEGIVSNTPIGSLATRRSTTTLPAEDAMAALDKIWNDRLPITIQTSLRVYTSMVMKSLSLPTDASTGDSLIFSATFKAINTVVVERRIVPVDRPRSSRKRKLGKKASKTNATAKNIGGINATLTGSDTAMIATIKSVVPF